MCSKHTVIETAIEACLLIKNRLCAKTVEETALEPT